MNDLNRSRNLAVHRRAGCFHHLFLLPVLIAFLGLMLAGRVTAQTFTTLHNFSFRGRDGAGPYGGLLLFGNTLYGTTGGGGTWSNGTVFAINTDGTGFTNLYSFPAASPSPPYLYDGNGNGPFLSPLLKLIVSGDTLYGTAIDGGPWGSGTVFAINTDGTDFTNLYSFSASTNFYTTSSGGFYTNGDGANPFGGLTLSGNTLYGTAIHDGTWGSGTVFKVNTDGTAFSNLHSFTGSDGARPNGLVLSGNTLYGTAFDGGTWGSGTVFTINTDGTSFTNLYCFTALVDRNADTGGGTNTDGAFPNGVILSGNSLYGTTIGGGTSGRGTVFKVNTDGTGFSNLNIGPGLFSRLLLSGKSLYGTTPGYEAYIGTGRLRFSNGTVFALKTDGTDFTTIYAFSPALNLVDCVTNSDGVRPNAELILSGNTVYGTAGGGGRLGGGTVFSISFTPPLSIIPADGKEILRWPTNYAGFDYTGYTLQSTTNLSSLVWTTNSTSPVVVNGQNTVTNPISGIQQFFRLSL